MAVQIFEELLVGGCHRDLVIEPQLCRRPERRQIFHRRAEYLDVGRMQFRPALQCGEALPPALAVGLFARAAVGGEHAACSGWRSSRWLARRRAGNPCPRAAPVRRRRDRAFAPTPRYRSSPGRSGSGRDCRAPSRAAARRRGSIPACRPASSDRSATAECGRACRPNRRAPAPRRSCRRRLRPRPRAGRARRTASRAGRPWDAAPR